MDDYDSIKLELAASQHNHKKDNEFHQAEIEGLRSELDKANAAYRTIRQDLQRAKAETDMAKRSEKWWCEFGRGRERAEAKVKELTEAGEHLLKAIERMQSDYKGVGGPTMGNIALAAWRKVAE